MRPTSGSSPKARFSESEPLDLPGFGPAPSGAVFLSHREQAGDPFGDLVARELAGIDSASQYIVTNAVVDPANLRPFYASQHGGRTLYQEDGAIVDSAQLLRTFKFDWTHAEGCELNTA